jgi:nucleobase:cation symporter-1, NCS1 family
VAAATLESSQPPVARAFHVEQHGIDRIADDERWARPRDLAGMWAGASIQVEYFVYGAILMTFGFNVAQALSLVVIGNLSYLLLGVCSLQGPQAGTTVFGINRAPYGPNGSRLVAFFNWLTMIGFEVEGLILIVGAALVLCMKSGADPGTPAKVALVIGAVAVQAVLPFLGHATIVKTLRVLIVPFVVLFCIMSGFAAPHVDLSAASHGASWQVYMGGLAFTIALSGLGWTECGNDYSRYLPTNASKPAVVGWVTIGTAIPQALLMVLGIAVGTFLTSVGTASNAFLPFAHQAVFPSWFVVVFLLFSIVQLFGVNSLDLYSSGVTLQALGLPVRRYQAVVLDSAICLGITLYATFNASFNTLLKDFVAVVIAWIAPWVAIFLVDWIMRRYRYAPLELQRTDRRSLYWANGGIHWPAVIAQAVGTVLSVLAISQPFFVGPIAGALGGGGADLSIFTGMAAGGLAYWLLARSSVQGQRVVQDRLLGGAAG